MALSEDAPCVERSSLARHSSWAVRSADTPSSSDARLLQCRAPHVMS